MIEKGLGERCEREGVWGERCEREGVGGEV